MNFQRATQTKATEAVRPRSTTVNKPLISASTAAHPLLQLQRQIGNRAVTQLIQAKLSVSQPNDAYEQEADRVAHTVMRMPDPLGQRQPVEEEAIQAAPIGRITPLMQRQMEEEKEEPVQTLQRQIEEEKEEPVQTLQRQIEEEKEEPVQTLQRQVEEEEKPVQAKAAHQPPEVTSDIEARIQSMRGSGQPLPASTRAFFEPRFGYDFSGVRIHSGSQAGEVAQQLNAQAFTLRQDIFFGRGYYQPDTFQGRSLLAHELTHTVQQQPQPLSNVRAKIQTSRAPFNAPIQAKSNWLQSPLISPTPLHVQRQSLPISSTGWQIQRSPIDDALDWIAEQAAFIPGYTLLTVIIGRNPINNRRVEPTATNLVQGLLELIPVVGRLLFTALQSSGALDRVFNWLRQEIGQLNITWDTLWQAFRRVDVSVSDAFNLRGALRRFETEFAPIIERVRRFAAGVRDRVITLIKEAILRPLGNFAKGLPSYPLLTVILGKDPITDERVERNATNVIRGILLLLPGGEEKFQNLQRSGIIDRAFNWFNQELTRLNLTWNSIKAIFARVWESLSVNDILSPRAAFDRISNLFSEPVQRITTFAGAAVRKVAEFIFEGVLTLAGGLGQQVLGIFNRARSVISSIIENPIGFIGNLVNALRRGFQQFSGNILSHLRTGLVGWLFGALSGAGLQLPERFDLRGIVSLVMQILGLTYARLRTILVRLIGEENISRVERVFEFLVMIATQGISAAWERIVEFVGNLQELVMGGIRDWVARTIIGQAITRLVTLFNPAGAIIQAIMAIYNTVVFFIERAQQIGALVEAVFSSITTIASGNIAAAANYVEQTMARTIPVVISFLARLIGLGGISDQIRNVVRRIQAPIERAMERVANWIVSRVRGLLGGGRDQAAGQRTSIPDIEQAAPIGAEQHTLKAHIENGSVTILMASNGYADIAIRLANLRRTYVEQHFPATGQAQLASALDTKLQEITTRKDQILTEGTRLQPTGAAALNPDAMRPYTQFMNNGLRQLGTMLEALGIQFHFGGGRNVKEQDSVRLISEGRGLLVNQVGQLIGSDFGIWAQAPDGTSRMALLYKDFGTRWDQPAKPPFVPFPSGGSSRTVVIDDAHLNRAGGTGASGVPPGLNTKWSFRGHLVPQMFGGPGGVGSGNIVAMTLTANGTNRGMPGIDNRVRDDIRSNDAVYRYTITTVRYDPARQVPPVEIIVTAQRLYPNTTNPSTVVSPWTVDNK